MNLEPYLEQYNYDGGRLWLLISEWAWFVVAVEPEGAPIDRTPRIPKCVDMDDLDAFAKRVLSLRPPSLIQ